MGCVKTKPELCTEGINFIADHTTITKDKIDQHYDSFLLKYPDGKITKSGYATMMRAFILVEILLN